MKVCAYCGKENLDAAGACAECASVEFAAAPLGDARAAVGVSASAQGDEKALCTVCVCANAPTAAFCKECGAPMGIISTVGPLESCFAEGFAYRRAVDGSTKQPIVILGIWILFLPPVLVALVALSAGMASAGAEMTIMFALMGLISGAILFKATRNYFGGRVARLG